MTKGLHKNSLRKGEPNKWIVEDIIEKLRAEVERLKEENNNIRCDSNKAYCQGYGDAFVDLLPFLDTLQEQPVEDKEELSDFESALFSAFSDMWQSYMRGEEINVAEHIRRISPQLLIVASRQNKQPVSEDVSKEKSLSLQIQAYLNTCSDELYAEGKPLYSEYRQKEIHDCMAMWKKLHDNYFYNKSFHPVSEKLEEEIEYYLDHAELKAKCNGISVAQDYFDDLTNAARHFAKWGAEHYFKSEFLSKFVEMTGSIDTMPKNTLPPSKECEKGLREPLVSDNLEEAAEEYGKVHTDEVMVSDGYHNDHAKEVFDVTPGEAFIAEAKWQEEQDLKYISEIHRNGYNLCKEQMTKGLRSYCLDEMERFQGTDEGSRAAREVYYDIIGYLDNYERR